MTNRILLAAIALGLWANAAIGYVRPVRADTEGLIAETLGSISGRLAVIGDPLGSIESDANRASMRTEGPRP